MPITAVQDASGATASASASERYDPFIVSRVRTSCAAAKGEAMTNRIAITARRFALCAVPLVLMSNFAAAPVRAQDTTVPAQTQSQTQNQASFSQAQIEQLVAPIALYPDSLLTQILMASTYPLEVVEAARWSRDNLTFKGEALQSAMQAQSWDPSVKALTAVPQTLEMMNDKLAWMEELGDAFLAQQQDVLGAVQKLRAEAQAAGNLQSTPQQIVTTAPAPAGVVASGVQRPIVIEPVNPDLYYVPVYNPAVVYGAWDYPDYPPFNWSPAGFVASNVISFGAGVAVGAAIWGGCDWWHNNVIINVNQYNIFNHANIANNVWAHDPAHRGNIPYPNAALAQRLGRTNGMAARDAFRRDVEAGHDDLLRDRAALAHVDPPKDHMDDQRADAFHRAEDDASRKIPPATPDRHDEEVRRDDGDRVVDRAMPERREIAPERNDARRQFMRSRAQVFRPERGAIGGGFHFHGGGRGRL
jgi:hypothetical protein